MGTKVYDAAEFAGVECPKKTGEMKESESCQTCQFHSRCMAAIYRAMGVER